jgi:hypothetical protein
VSEPKHFLSIWLFIGALLLLYGVMILGAGIYYWLNPLPQQTVLSELHAPIWWGALLVALGAIYTYLFRPGREK